MNKRLCKFFPREVLCDNEACKYTGCYWYFVHRSHSETLLSKSLFYEKCALPLSKSGCTNFHKKALILKPECMQRIGLELNLLYQIVIADLGPGLFPNNPVGFIDVKLFCDRNVTFTIYRKDVYGVVSPLASERYDEYYNLGLARYMRSI